MKGKNIVAIAFAGIFCFLFSGCGTGDNSSSSSGHVHELEKFEAKQVTCFTGGLLEHYYCSGCASYFLDENATQKAEWKDITVGKISHRNMQHKQTVAPTATTDGKIEHWYCPDCQSYYLDAKGERKVAEDKVVLSAGIYQPDFTVEVPVGRDPVVLQLTDTQLISLSNITSRCTDYVEETIEQTNPDLILITGDLVYGRHDPDGSLLQTLIAFMESFETPWAPVFGNHDNESEMGADWQCQQLESAEYCLFKQRTLTGNGNYTVGIKQGGQLTRVFVMLDSNGCGDASTASLSNGHTNRSVGFQSDQVAWYTQEVTALRAQNPQMKVSFAFHVQLYVFSIAMSKYGYASSGNDQNIWINTSTDFGHIGRPIKSTWDTSLSIFNGMKALGADSIFVGHEHCNSASVIYQGVRLQYGQKSSTYDRYNIIASDNKVQGSTNNVSGTPLLGGTVMTLSQTSGAITNAYIYYCQNAGGKLDWDTIFK